MSYFIIYGDEDGGHIEGPLSKSALLEKITPRDGVNFFGRDRFLSDLFDFNYWPDDALLILEGTVVLPTEKDVVTIYDI